MMRLAGWRFVGAFPDVPKLVAIVVPHTSNWDFPVGVFAKAALGLRVRYLGKDSLFRAPYGWFFRWLGGIPVDRSSSHQMVDSVAELFARSDKLVLVIAPEGTRRKVERWRTGFYHIARAAGVPVIPIGFDWGTHAIRIGPPFTPTGDLDADLAELQRWFSDVRGRNY